MSALTAHPVVAPAPSRTPRRRHLQLVGPGFEPQTGRSRPVPARPDVRPDATSRVVTPRPTTSVRLTRRGRRLLASLALVGATALSVTVGAWAALADGTGEAAETVTVTVAPGETLWSVAGEVAGPGTDVRDVVTEIVAINGLSSSEVQAGQQLLVPTD